MEKKYHFCRKIKKYIMPKKCILLVRVSTDKQSLDEQEQELETLAISYGYKKNEIAHVAHHESAIKLDEEERAGLNEMKDLIESGEYDCVFAWEISRIARRKKILFSILEYLVSRKIQLVIKEPRIVLLKSDGSIDEGAETVFTLFAQISESEMRNKAVRFARGRKEGYNKGLYMGGKIARGYKLGENGQWIVDEDDSPGHMGAPFIRRMFELYNTGKYSSTTLGQELQARGYFPGLSITNVKCEIYQMLRRRMYLGERTSNNIYPAIIDQETWDKCQARRSQNRYINKAKNPHLLTPLIRCQCGATYSVNVIDASYSCRIRHNAVEKGLKHSPDINANLIESIAWFVALRDLQQDIINNKNIAREKYEAELNIIDQKILHSKQVLSSTLERKTELDESYFVHGRFTKEKYEEITRKQNETIKTEKANLLKYENQKNILNSQIQSEVTFDDILNNLKESYHNLHKGTDMETMRKIVHRYISSIEIEPIEGRSIYYRKIVFHTIYESVNKENLEKMKSDGNEDLAFVSDIFTNVFYAYSRNNKVYYDASMTKEVPMFFINRLTPKKRFSRTNKGKRQMNHDS